MNSILFVLLFFSLSSIATPKTPDISCSHVIGEPSVSEIIETLSEGSKVQSDIEQVYARVLRGVDESDFNTLSDDPARKIVMVMDSQGLHAVSGVSKDQMLIEIGYTQDYVDYLKDQGTEFRLLVFKESEGVYPATWDGLGQTLKMVYGETVYNLFLRHRRALESQTYEEIQALKEITFKAAYEMGSENSSYVEVSDLDSNSTLWELRAFLYNELRLSELYTGDGFTKTEDGEVGIPEYFFVNRNVQDISDLGILNL